MGCSESVHEYEGEDGYFGDGDLVEALFLEDKRIFEKTMGVVEVSAYIKKHYPEKINLIEPFVVSSMMHFRHKMMFERICPEADMKVHRLYPKIWNRIADRYI